MKKRLAQLAIGSMIAVTPFTVSVLPTAIPGLMGSASAGCIDGTCSPYLPNLNQQVCNGGGNCCNVSNHINSGCIAPPPCDPNCAGADPSTGTVATEP